MARGGCRGGAVHRHSAARDALGKVDERLSHAAADHDNPSRFVTLAGFTLLSLYCCIPRKLGYYALSMQKQTDL